MKKRRHITGYLLGLALALVSLASAAMAQGIAPKQNGKIAFTSDRDGNREIYVMNADGSNQIRITNNTLVDDHPTWSPNGTKIAFLSQKQNGSFAIFTMNADGTDRTEITAFNGSGEWASWRPLSWSPDGGRIAFHDASAVSGSIDIFVVNVDGSGRQDLTADHAHLDLTPVWSPDGSKILFSRYDTYPPVGYGGTMLHTINVDGTNLTPLVNGFADGWNEDFPDWSPAVNKIVYSVNVWDFYFDLYIANPDGTGRQGFHHCSNGLDAMEPRFSPDGTKIVFRCGVQNKTDIIFSSNTDGTDLRQLTNSGRNYSPSWQPLLPTACPNPIDCNEFFVRQHYHDFLNREPDAPGLAHWAGEITFCNDLSRRLPGETLALCLERKRTTTSAAFFLSPEFQYTGYFVYRLYKGSLIKNGAGRVPIYQEFLRDVRQVASGIIQNNQLAAAAIEQNKKTFAEEFTRRAEFRSLYDPLSNFDYVERLFQTTGINVSANEKQALVDGLNNQTETRASVLQKVIDGTEVIVEGNQQFTTSYGRAFYEKEFNSAFVLMEYFGYLRRDPDAPGYQHWLDKLNTYGNYIDAEMVKSFILSPEYRARFGQP